MLKTQMLPIAGMRDEGNFRLDDVMKVAVNRINNDDYFKGRRMHEESKDIQVAQEKINHMLGVMAQSVNTLIATEETLTTKSRQIGGKVRDAADKLSTGLAKIEKAANFDRLERYVELLERAAAAMGTLAELEKLGKLEKIAAAIR